MAHFKDKSECAIHVDSDHCTPKHVISDMASQKGIILKDNPVDTLNELKQHTKCETELCVVEHFKKSNPNDMINQIIDNNFKIKGPKYDVEKWLSNDDIDKTLEQWAISKKNFYPIPFQMRDFSKNKTELCTLDFPELANTHSYFGCVPNTDWSTGKGQHWFALFFDFSKTPYTLEYFNSSGEDPLSEYNDWLNDAEQDLQKKMNKPVTKVIVTKVQNQYDDSSCGCYALYYIYSRLNGVDWKWFRNNRVSDKKMHEFRKFLFNPED